MRKIRLIEKKVKQRYTVYRVVLIEDGREVYTEVEIAKTSGGLEKFIELLKLTGWEVEHEAR